MMPSAQHRFDPDALAVRAVGRVTEGRRGRRAEVTVREVGTVLSVDQGVVRVAGLPGARAEELLRLADGQLALVLDLSVGVIGAVLLDRPDKVEAGQVVERTERVADVPVGSGLLGRVIDPAGRPLDGRGPLESSDRRELDQIAPPILDRAPVDVPLQTGIKVVDALLPIGRGQRELILGDRQTGKTSIAVDAILNQADSGVLSVYCAIAQRSTELARVIDVLERRGALERTVVVATTGEDPAGLQYLAPYAATSIAEHFTEHGHDVVVVYDDLTRHARAYRELALLLRRPPGREAFPGDIFYVHSRLLERATRLVPERGGGSLTALPIAETEEQNLAAYIPTNLISITDGQIYLSPRLFQQGQLPAVDVGLSVSRVGGKAQLPAYRAVAADLRLAYAQFEELERFERFGATLKGDQARELGRGARVRAVLRQPLHEPVRPAEQIAVFVAVNDGLLDGVELSAVAAAERAVRRAVRREASDVVDDLEGGEELTERRRRRLSDLAAAALGVPPVAVQPTEDDGADA
ncbi:MAG TPA: F0F1 ATP synthase subunit alpha [Egicoccus sp.]|nr:F0F1 ATP synthase subunit alpha [Egicoccus sp.]HSK24588.1 F0F1 ATP synthase subunit alpha [Egicoccus sp.]